MIRMLFIGVRQINEAESFRGKNRRERSSGRLNGIAQSPIRLPKEMGFSNAEDFRGGVRFGFANLPCGFSCEFFEAEFAGSEEN